MSTIYHLAQANIALMRAPLDSPVMAGFVEQLEHINSVADQSGGFVWRLQTEDGDATAIRVFDNEKILFNMSVWESVEALFDYTYRGPHNQPFRQRGNWFEPHEGARLVLWWIQKDHTPTVEEAKEKFALLEKCGPTAQAFTFKQRFPAPNDGQ